MSDHHLLTCSSSQTRLHSSSVILMKINPVEVCFILSLCSQELLGALGITTNTLPPFIYRMRELGYPPGWLKEAETENSGLTLYDGKIPLIVGVWWFLRVFPCRKHDSRRTLYVSLQGSNDGDERNHSQKISYDVSKLVDFPGFNCSAAPSVRDVSEHTLT